MGLPLNTFPEFAYRSAGSDHRWHFVRQVSKWNDSHRLIYNPEDDMVTCCGGRSLAKVADGVFSVKPADRRTVADLSTAAICASCIRLRKLSYAGCALGCELGKCEECMTALRDAKQENS
jgi:hypothetical protein